jgi:hypothetical protein
VLPADVIEATLNGEISSWLDAKRKRRRPP